MKPLRLTSMFVYLAALLMACNVSKSLSLDDARAAYAHNSEIISLIDSATEVQQFCGTEYGIKPEKGVLRFQPGSASHLVWEVTAVEPMSLQPIVQTLFATKEAALAKKAALEKDGKEVYLSPRNPLLVSKKPAPLLESWISWPYERKIERVMQLIMYRYAGKELKRKDAETLARFLAEKATEEFLRKKLNPASPVLARYISEERDARTFANLFPDFAIRVKNLYENKDPTLNTETVQKVRTMLLRTWLVDFHQKYADRFLTNKYVQFGEPLPGDAEIAAWENHYEHWKDYNTAFMQAGESVAAFVAELR